MLLVNTFAHHHQGQQGIGGSKFGQVKIGALRLNGKCLDQFRELLQFLAIVRRGEKATYPFAIFFYRRQVPKLWLRL